MSSDLRFCADEFAMKLVLLLAIVVHVVYGSARKVTKCLIFGDKGDVLCKFGAAVPALDQE